LSNILYRYSILGKNGLKYSVLGKIWYSVQPYPQNRGQEIIGLYGRWISIGEGRRVEER